jgi:nucleoside-diphosphate-sugar epimerase
MRDIVVVGAGKIGSTIADMLGASGDYRVTVADRSESAACRHPQERDAVEHRIIDIADRRAEPPAERAFRGAERRAVSPDDAHRRGRRPPACIIST